jgi:TPR repeat protein
MSDLGCTFAIGEVVTQDWAEAFTWFKAAADASYSLAYVNVAGRGLHSSTSQLNLSRVCHKKTPYTPSSPPNTP